MVNYSIYSVGFIKKLFFNKREKQEENTTEKYCNNYNLLEKIKVDTKIDNKEYARKEFMENLKRNPDLLNNFPNDKLEKILQYYIEENEKKKEILKKFNI